MSRYHGPHFGAILLACAFAGGTAFVLFDDLRHGAPFSIAHVLTGLALIGTIASGHYLSGEISARRIPMAVGLAVLFCAGTAYIVTSSGARNAELAEAKAARAQAANDERSRETTLLRRAEAMLTAARGDVAKQCHSGPGPLCRGARATQDVYAAAVRGHNARLAELGPQMAVNGGYAHAARVIAALPFVTSSAGDIETRLVLLLPFLLVGIQELGTVVFVGMALRPRRRRPLAIETSQTSFPTPDLFGLDQPDPTPPSGTRRQRRSTTELRRQQVTSFVHAYRAKHGTDPSPAAVRAATGLPRATAFRYQRAVA